MERKSLREEVAEKIKGLILNGELLPGEKIVIADLAQKLGVSITPVREALHQLAATGLVCLEPHKGFYVRKWTKREIENLLYLRAYLERLAVRLFVERASQEDLKLLKQTLERMKEAAQRNEIQSLLELNSQFHTIIVEKSANDELINVVSSLREKLHRVRQMSLSYPGRAAESFAEHAAIYAAIEERNVAKAEQMIEKHILSVMNVLLKMSQNGYV